MFIYILLIFIFTIILIGIFWSKSYYYLGKFYTSTIDPVDIYKVRHDPYFSVLDGYVGTHLSEIQMEVRTLVQSNPEISMHEFDDVHRELMVKSQFKDGWRTIWLRYLGNDMERVKSLNRIQEMLNKFDTQILNASISILEPSAEIPLHRGELNAVVKYHIPIDIPKGDIGIEIEGETFKWDSQNRLIFDDTRYHRVWNHTRERRVILLMDVYRPLSKAQTWLGHILLKISQWTRGFRQTYNRIN